MGKFSICGQVAANTGSVDCDITRGVPQLLILGSASFAPGDYASAATFKAAFIAKTKLGNDASDKLFPFPVIQGLTDQTVAAKTGTLGYGLVVKLQRSKPGYELDVLAGTSLEKKLIKFDGKTLPGFVFDDQDNIWGTLDNTLNFKGAKYLIGVEPAGFGDGQNVKTTKVTISLIDSKDFTENSAVASTDFSTSDLVGLLDAIPYETAVHAVNVYHIGLKIATDSITSAIKVHDTTGYAALLADPDMWDARTGANFGTALTITSVTDDTTNGGWTITYDSTAYTALSSGAKIQLTLVDPPTLDAAGVTGIEGGALILTK